MKELSVAESVLTLACACSAALSMLAAVRLSCSSCKRAISLKLSSVRAASDFTASLESTVAFSSRAPRLTSACSTLAPSKPPPPARPPLRESEMVMLSPAAASASLLKKRTSLATPLMRYDPYSFLAASAAVFAATAFSPLMEMTGMTRTHPVPCSPPPFAETRTM